LRFVRPIRYAGATFGTVDLVLRRTALDEALADARALLIALALAVVAAAALVGWLGAAAVARPLKRLRDALDSAGESDWGFRLPHRRRDEFGAAFDAFNRAADAIEPRLLSAPIIDVGETRIAGETRIESAPMRKAA
jgi:serine/threonine-protein kinase